MKESFLRYVARTPGTRVSVGDGAGHADSGEFVFPAVGHDAGVLRFGGDVLFVGHGGLMHVGLADPWIQAVGAGAALSVVHDGGGGARPGRIHVADLVWEPQEPQGSPLPRWRVASATLATAGVGVFDGAYGVGELMAPVRLRLDRAAG